MELGDFELCPKCNAVMKTEYCLNCGHNIDKKKTDEQTLPVAESKKEVKSIFDELVAPDYDLLTNNEEAKALDTAIISESKKGRIILMLLLALVLMTILGVFSYLLYFKNLQYIKPGEIETAKAGVDVDAILANIKAVESTGVERTLELATEFKEGNFEKINFAVFAAPDTNMLIEMFDFKDFLKNVVNQGELYDQFKKDFDLNDDDFEVYFEKSFALIFPENDFDKWGLILSTKDEKFAAKVMDSYKKLAQNPKSIYATYLVDLKKIDDENYILISNSKVYLDQMVESSEGNLPNLSQDGLYVGVMQDLPKLGSVTVYKKTDTRTWDYVTEWAVNKYADYVGLDQIMQQMGSRAVSIYSKDGKTKVITSKE